MDKDDEKCDCECCCEEKKEQTMTGMAIDLGDKAWSAVIQRKMEARLEKTMGKQMGKVADIMTEYAHKYYAAAMQDKQLSKSETAAFEKKLNEAMM